MKRVCLLILLLSQSLYLCAQITTRSTYNPLTIEEILAPVVAATNAHNQLRAEMEALQEYLMEILSRDIDSQMRSSINEEYKRLNSQIKILDEQGYSSTLRSMFNACKQRVKQKVVDYNNRIAQQREVERIKRQQQEEKRQAQQTPEKWSGTGFALKDGYVVTNYHVVKDATSINIQGVKGDFNTHYKATVVATDKFNDLALLQIIDDRFGGFGILPYSVRTSVSEMGEDIFVLGYPLINSMGDDIKLSTGVISSKTGFQGDVSLYQISAPIQPGNSGGPLFDNKGNLIGIVNSKHKGAENVGYAIKVSYLKNLIESYVSTSILPNNNQIAGLPLTGKVKSIKNFVFLITCSTKSMYKSNTNYAKTDNNIKSQSSHTRKNHQQTQSNIEQRNEKKQLKLNTSISQKVLHKIENPYVGKSMTLFAKITSIEIGEKYTAITIEQDNYISGVSNINEKCYIWCNNKVYYIQAYYMTTIVSQGEKESKSEKSNKVQYILYFQPLPTDVLRFNLIVDVDKNKLRKFYEVSLKR